MSYAVSYSLLRVEVDGFGANGPGALDAVALPAGGYVLASKESLYFSSTAKPPIHVPVERSRIDLLDDDNVVAVSNVGDGLRAQIYAGDGTAVGGSIDLKLTGHFEQDVNLWDVARLNSGFVVASYTARTGNLEWHAYLKNGAKSGQRITEISGLVDHLEVTALNGGRFLVNYEREVKSTFGSKHHTLTAAVYNADGSVHHDAFNIRGSKHVDISDSRVAALSNGGFAMTYTYRDDDDDKQGVALDIFDRDGNRKKQIDLAETDPGNIGNPDVALTPDGILAVTWRDNTQMAHKDHVRINCEVFDETGSSLPGLAGPFEIAHSATRANTTVAAGLTGSDIGVTWGTNTSGGSYKADLARNVVCDGEDDTYFGDGMRDFVKAGDGRDFIMGNSGDDVLKGENGDDFLYGMEDNDTLYGGDGTDNLDGGDRSDKLHGDDGDDDITGGAGSDRLYGDAGADFLSGGADWDELNGGAGLDTLKGGAGEDTYTLDSASLNFNKGAAFVFDKVIENADEGTHDEVKVQRVDSGKFHATHYTLTDNVEVGTIVGNGAFDLSGNGGDNTLKGNDAVNVLKGLAGADALDGGKGADRMEGGAGDDTYRIDDVGDRIVEESGAGTDTVTSTVSVTAGMIGSYVENIKLKEFGAPDAKTVVGNARANTIEGNDQENVLDGGKGADTMKGGFRDDTYIVDNKSDKVVEQYPASMGGGEKDLVKASVSFTLSYLVERLTLTGAHDINGTGNDLENVIVGNGHDNVLNGREGADDLTGGKGGDTFSFNTAISSDAFDTITDFKPADDTIRLENKVFKDLESGTLDASAFGYDNTDVSDRIIYDSETGKLYFDRDGSKTTYSAVHFATVDAHLALTHSDFVVV